MTESISDDENEVIEKMKVKRVRDDRTEESERADNNKKMNELFFRDSRSVVCEFDKQQKAEFGFRHSGEIR